MSKQAALWEFNHNPVFTPAEAEKTFFFTATASDDDRPREER